jgi:short-subunit dehydrogenase
MQARAERERDSAEQEAAGAAIKKMNDSPRWAIVTGASSGIGRALALEFAGGGHNLLLTGRNQTALERVAEECRARFAVQTKIVAADLARPEAVDTLIEAISALPLEYHVLVNNAGFGVHGEFADTEIGREVEMVNVQLAAMLKLTKAVLPGMVARRGGRILNVGSVYSYAPVPFQSVYAACKAFLQSFSASLRNELADTGVTVTLICPGITQTEFRSRAGIVEKDTTSGMTAQDVAHLGFVETMRGKPVVIPGLENRLFVVVAKLLPSSMFTGIIRFINRLRGHRK